MKGRSFTPVILDTNALLMMFEYRINLEDELTGLLGTYEILIPTAVLHELRYLQNSQAKAAYKFAERYRTIESVNKGDEAILSLAIKLNAVVVTNDRELRRRLKENELRVIYIRQRSYLAMDIP
ncbi:MAG: twitching motility protein PilT [Thermoplasmata archaeon]|nr:MAG: twitching motility protein PilT [Thermoplasmata archaeon]